MSTLTEAADAAHAAHLRAAVEENAALRSEVAHAETMRQGAETRAAHAELCEKELRDCGQDGVCAIAPGCIRHFAERGNELVGERDDLRAELATAANVTRVLSEEKEVAIAVGHARVHSLAKGLREARAERDAAVSEANVLRIALADLHDAATSMPRGSMDTDEQWGNRVGSSCAAADRLLSTLKETP